MRISLKKKRGGGGEHNTSTALKWNAINICTNLSRHSSAASAPAGCITCSWGWCHPYPGVRLQLPPPQPAPAAPSTSPPQWGPAEGLGTPDPVTAARLSRWHNLSLHGLGFHCCATGFSFESMMYMHIQHVFVMFLSLSGSPIIAFLFKKMWISIINPMLVSFKDNFSL